MFKNHIDKKSYLLFLIPSTTYSSKYLGPFGCSHSVEEDSSREPSDMFSMSMLITSSLFSRLATVKPKYCKWITNIQSWTCAMYSGYMGKQKSTESENLINNFTKERQKVAYWNVCRTLHKLQVNINKTLKLCFCSQYHILVF